MKEFKIINEYSEEQKHKGKELNDFNVF